MKGQLASIMRGGQGLARKERTSSLVESAMTIATNFKDVKAVHAYITENGKKIGTTKLYEDIHQKYRLKKQPDGTFKKKDVNRYMASLPSLGTPENEADSAADRMKRREEAEIRRITAQAAKEELSLKERLGQLIDRQEVYELLAARAITLDSDIKGAIAARAIDIISEVEGKPNKAKNLITTLEGILNDAFREYAKTDEIEVMFKAPAKDDAPEDHEEEPEP